jgi:hypothetical protein
MNLNDMLSAVDAEISRLQQARAALLNGTDTTRRGKKSASSRPAKVKRTMSPEARENIANAQRKRWAAQKKAAK